MPSRPLHCFIELCNADDRIHLVSDGKHKPVRGLRRQAYNLIRYMLEQNAANGGADRIFTYEELVQAVWGQSRISNGPTQVARLVFEIRKSLTELESTADLIQTVPGRGYILRDGRRLERERDNPFVCGPPIRRPRRFYGRAFELRRILKVWNRFPLQHFAVIGHKRSGKTSLLRFLAQIYNTPECDFRPGQLSGLPLKTELIRIVFIDCQDSRLQTSGAMMEYILEQLEMPVPWPCSPSSFAQRLSELTRPTVLLFDELEAALFNPEFGEHFWMGLRSLANHISSGQLGYVIAVHPELGDLVRAKASPSPFLNIFGHVLHLGPLTESEARELIGSSPEPFPEEDVLWILSESGCHPCLLQLLCDTRFTAMHENQPEELWKKEGLARISQFQHLLGRG